MRRALSGIAAAVLIGFGLACSGGTSNVGGGGGDDLTNASTNAEACAAYVTHFNGLDCVHGNLDVSRTCDGTDRLPDMKPYYSCMVQNSTCNGKKPKIKADKCKMPGR